MPLPQLFKLPYDRVSPKDKERYVLAKRLSSFWYKLKATITQLCLRYSCQKVINSLGVISCSLIILTQMARRAHKCDLCHFQRQPRDLHVIRC